MTTPERSESEIANEYSERIRERLHHFYGNTAAEHEIVAILKIALTTALQAECQKREEMVEAERERFGKILSEIEIGLKNSNGSKLEIEGIIWTAHEAITTPNNQN